MPYSDIAEEIAITLRTRRESLKITQTGLAETTGVPRANIIRIEKGQHQPTFDVLEKMARGLNLDLVLSFEEIND